MPVRSDRRLITSRTSGSFGFRPQRVVSLLDTPAANRCRYELDRFCALIMDGPPRGAGQFWSPRVAQGSDAIDRASTGRFTMDRFVIAQNIANFRSKLMTVKDDRQRQILLRLLAEEEAKNDLPRESDPVIPPVNPIGGQM